MNFFGHATVASWRSEQAGFVLGAMLPDFVTMIRARPPRVRHDDLEAGVRFHHETDRVFHDLADFRALDIAARGELRDLGLRRGSALAVAHIGTEILLDRILAQDEGAREAYTNALSAGRDEALGGHIEWSEPEADRYRRLHGALEERGINDGPLDATRLAERIGRALAGRPRLCLDAPAEKQIARWLPAAAGRVAKRAESIAQTLRARLVT